MKHRNLRRGLLALAGVAVLALTVWALVLPGVTMANAAFCGQEEHEHSDACYQEILVCGFGEDGEAVGGSAANAGDSSGSAEGSTAASSGAAGSAGVVESGAENAAGSETGGSSASSVGGAASAGVSSDASGAASSGAGANSSDSGFAGADASASDGADTALPASEDSLDGAAALSSAGDAVVLASGNAAGMTPALAVTSSDAAALGLGAESGAGSSSEASGHVHTDACYERVLVCGLSEHEHSLACYSDSSADLETEAVWEATLPADDEMTGNWAADVLAVAKSQLGYRESSANYVVAENAAGTEVAKGYTRYGTWWGDAYGDWCAMFASFCLSYAGVPEEAVPQNANCQNWIEALSAESMQLWRPVELVENAEGTAERTGVAVVPAEVAAAWEAEATELEEETAEEEAANAEASGEGVFADADAASADSDADEGEGASGASLEAALLGGSSARYTALGNLVYDPQPGDLVFFDWNNDGSADHVGLVYELLDADGNVVAEAVAPESDVASSSVGGEGSEDVPNSAADAAAAGVAGDSAAEGVDAAAVADSSASAAKLKTIEGNVSDGSTDAVCCREYDLTDSSILGYAALPENPELQAVTLAFDEVSLQEESAQASSGPTSFKGASTRDFVEINLYDYGSNINEKYNGNKNYPGFQQDNGTSSVGGSFGKYGFNFGNNVTKDLRAGNTNVTGQGGDINKTVGSWGGADYGVANLPIERAMLGSLKDGYPALADETSLEYLFSDGTYASKQNEVSIDGLFKYDEKTGAYSFNSRENHAQFNSGNDTFTLYNQVITSNFMMYPFGNFLPFNNIETQCKQASSIDKAYLQSVAADAQKKNGSEYQTLSSQLTKFISLMDGSYPKDKYPKGWTGVDCANEYFKAAGISKAFTAADLSNVYSIDYDEPTDFFFGMEMKMRFTQPKGGLTGKDGQQPMVFYFTGDDDVWVYVDDVLFLDLSGIHRHVGGEIDFVNGVVKYYALDVSTGDVSTTPYKTVEFSDLVGADQLNKEGAFKDYSTHSFNFYYMERGAGSGVCRMNFNFPLLKQNTISVAKEVESTTPVLGDPDYKFQVLKANSDDVLIGAGTSYDIYDISSGLPGVKLEDSGTVGENGVFALKANQRAEFKEIAESSGEYYVRELFDSSAFEQYDEIEINTGGTVETVKPDWSLSGAESFVGATSSVRDASAGSALFKFKNAVDEEKLASLSIAKKLEEYPQAREAKQFDIEVRLDGAFLPPGTKYTVAGGASEQAETREVPDGRPGVVTLRPGETATIGNILAGTSFSVQEVAGSAEGYAVTYAVDNGGPVFGSAAGILSAATKVNVLVTNKEKGASVVIPGTKSVAATDGLKHEFSFALYSAKRVDGQGSAQDAFSVDTSDGASPLQSEKVDLREGGSSFSFTVDYALADLPPLPATFYYCIAEEPSKDALPNNTAYVVEVTASDAPSGESSDDAAVAYSELADSVGEVSAVGGAKAEITRAWVGRLGKDGFVNEGQCFGPEFEAGEQALFSADFANILAGSLELSKKVVGAEADKAFEFEVSLNPEGSGLEALPESYPATLYSSDDDAGRSVEVKLTKKDDGEFVLVLKSEDGENDKPVALRDGERIVINGIPYGTKWAVTEINSEGFIVSTEVVCPTSPSGEPAEGDAASGAVLEAALAADSSAGDNGPASLEGSGVSAADSSSAVSGSIVMGTAQVNFTNTQMYELPETGGLGAAVCVFAGLALVGAALFGMRRICHRGEAV